MECAGGTPGRTSPKTCTICRHFIYNARDLCCGPLPPSTGGGGFRPPGGGVGPGGLGVINLNESVNWQNGGRPLPTNIGVGDGGNGLWPPGFNNGVIRQGGDDPKPPCGPQKEAVGSLASPKWSDALPAGQTYVLDKDTCPEGKVKTTTTVEYPVYIDENNCTIYVSPSTDTTGGWVKVGDARYNIVQRVKYKINVCADPPPVDPPIDPNVNNDNFPDPEVDGQDQGPDPDTYEGGEDWLTVFHNGLGGAAKALMASALPLYPDKTGTYTGNTDPEAMLMSNPNAVPLLAEFPCLVATDPVSGSEKVINNLNDLGNSVVTTAMVTQVGCLTYDAWLALQFQNNANNYQTCDGYPLPPGCPMICTFV